MLCEPIYFGERDHDNQCNQASRSLIVPLPAAQSAPIPIPRRARPPGIVMLAPREISRNASRT